MNDSLSFEQESAKNLKSFMVTLASYYTVALYLVFSVVDLIFYRQLFLEFLAVRVFVVLTLVGIVQYLNTIKNPEYNFVQKICTVPFAACTFSIYYMLYRINDPQTSYWAGLAIITAGLSIGFAFSWRYYVFNLALNLLPLLAFDAFFYFREQNLNGFLNVIFLASVSLVCAIGRWFYLRLSVSEYENRLALANEVISRNKIIEQKTQESVRLNALSKQFSPQIVQSIQEGKISLSSKLHKSEICAIFVDIKDSTVKFSGLDRDDLQKVISLYIEDVMGVFLKYDITIDKFLGDGVLGFTNDPVSQHDYLERALLAAVEIKNKILLKQEIYNQLWKSNFEIRIGLASGEASVGFYGSDVHVKSYTAIGRVINLSNRINGAAPANEIAVSTEILDKIKDHNESFLRDYQVTDLLNSELKGFERERVKISLIDKMERPSVIDDENCPHGHGPLVISQLNNGIYAMKCRYCDFVLEEKPPQFGIKAS